MQRISELEKDTAHLKHSYEKYLKHLEFFDEIDDFEHAVSDGFEFLFCWESRFSVIALFLTFIF
jgi:hypothetical protein